MKAAGYFSQYFETISQGLKSIDLIQLEQAAAMVWAVHQSSKKVILVGNGGSAAMASHVAVDFTKASGIRAVNFNEPDLITCFANDYGYEHWVEKAVEFYGDEGDMVILISSSGSSANMVNAAKTAKSMGMTVITFTGFKSDNPLNQNGHLNFWLDSKAYNIIENTHQIWLLMVCDLIIGEVEYSA